MRQPVEHSHVPTRPLIWISHENPPAGSAAAARSSRVCANRYGASRVGSGQSPSPRQRFEQADSDHDGRLTRAEAQAMPFVAKHFDAIDTNHDGYMRL